ncbi:MAG: biotin carboxylase N-terminal domain-containing protein [candidate division WOR-3 bacterium]
MFKKVLIATRGVPALRIIRSCRELGVKTVVPYSEEDRDSLPAMLADEAICIGPAPPPDSYANLSRLLSAAEVTRCDSLHPGWGFLASEPEFADATIASGINFIGPSPDCLRMFADRLEVRATIKGAEIPVIPGADYPIVNPASAAKVCDELGLPCVVKPVATRLPCTRIIRKEKDIEYQVRMCQAETRVRTGSEQVVIEKFLSPVRPIEIQIVADTQGNIRVINDWEILLYFRGKNFLAVSPALNIDKKEREQLFSWAKEAGKATKITGCVTVEFLIDQEARAYFSRFNPELSVFHPLTEVRTGIDVIEEQMKVASGERVVSSERDVTLPPIALATQIFAEDPDADFEPSPGLVNDLWLPSGPGVRVDSHLFPGYTVPPDYDLHIATLIASGADFESAKRRLLRALTETRINGIATNLDFLITAIKHPNFGTGKIFGQEDY